MKKNVKFYRVNDPRKSTVRKRAPKNEFFVEIIVYYYYSTKIKKQQIILDLFWSPGQDYPKHTVQSNRRHSLPDIRAVNLRFDLEEQCLEQLKAIRAEKEYAHKKIIQNHLIVSCIFLSSILILLILKYYF